MLDVKQGDDSGWVHLIPCQGQDCGILMRKWLLELLHQLFTSGLMTSRCYFSSVLEAFAICHSICSCGGHPCNSVKGDIYPDFCQGCTVFCLFILVSVTLQF